MLDILESLSALDIIVHMCKLAVGKGTHSKRTIPHAFLLQPFTESLPVLILAVIDEIARIGGAPAEFWISAQSASSRPFVLPMI